MPGPGNPHIAKVAKWRKAFVDCVTEADIKAVVKSLMDAAKDGDVPAIKEFLSRTIGDTLVTQEGGGSATFVIRLEGLNDDAPEGEDGDEE